MLSFYSLKEWYKWLKRTPWSLKWFILIILSKPIIDLFWYVKSSGFLSPGQLTGFLVFALSISYWLKANKNYTRATTRIYFNVFATLLVLNALVITIIFLSTSSIGEFLRITLPVFMFLYVKSYVKSYETVNGIFTTYIISSVLPLSMLVYEGIIGPIRVVELAESRGGGYRLTGLYADLFNYMSYIIGNFFIFATVFIENSLNKKKNKLTWTLIVLSITIFGLIGMQHQASWGVFAALGLMFLFAQTAKGRGKTTLVISIVLLILFSGILWDTVLSPLFSKEIEIVEGSEDQEKAFNGRIFRWQFYFNQWGQMSPVYQFFGVGISGKPNAPVMMSGGMHSDYVRFLFSTGIIGLISFVFFYVSLLVAGLKNNGALRYFTLGSVIILMLYGITSNPFGSSCALQYLTLVGLAIASHKK